MRILLVTAFFPPSDVIAAQRAWGFAKHWSLHGHDVTVLAPGATKPTGWRGTILTMPEPRLLRLIRVFLGGGQRVSGSKIVAPLGRPSLKSRLKMKILATGVGSSVRWPDPSGIWFRGARRLLREKSFDVVISTFGPPGAHLLAEWYKAKHPDVFWVADFRDLWTENFHFRGVWGLRWWERRLERRILLRANLVTTVSAPLAQSLEKTRRAGVQVILNGFDSDDWKALPELPPRRAKLQLFYGGSFYPERMKVDVFLEALSELFREGTLKTGDLLAEFCGPRTDAIVRMAQARGLEGFVVGGDVRPRSDALAAQKAADALLFFGYQDEMAADQGILTGKLFEYLGADRCIFGIGLSDRIEAGRLILESGRGLLASSQVSDVKAQLQALLSGGPGAFSSQPSRKIQEMTRERQALKLLDLLPRGSGDADR